MKYFCYIFLTLLVVYHLEVFAQNDPKCGTNGPAVSKIIGGEEATPFEFPWVVSLGFSKNGVYTNVCTGSIIHPKFILTAASCQELLKNALELGVAIAVVGAHNISNGAPEIYKKNATINEIITHEMFEQKEKIYSFYDIALVKLHEGLNFTENPDIGMICVPNQSDTKDAYVGQTSTTAGWGITIADDPASGPQRLNKVTLPVVSMDVCSAKYFITENTNTMVCTYAEGKDTCTGDNGSPMMLQINNLWTVVGTSSWAQGCAQKDYPRISTSISYFSDWIWRKINP